MRQRSLFFPLFLIVVGLLWLLVSLGYMPGENFWALTHVWPYLLILAGLSLIAKSVWEPSRNIGQAAAALLVIASILFAPQLGWNTPQWNFNIGGYDGAVPGSKNIITVTRSISGFDALDVEYPAEVVVRQGTSESLTIVGDDNLIPQLSTEVRSGSLVIENSESNRSKRVRPSQTVKITITVTRLHQASFSSSADARFENLETDALELNVSGAGSLRLENLKTDKLECQLSGVGNVTTNGSANDLVVKISGAGSFLGRDLATQTADAQVSGTGSAQVQVKNSLNAQISGVGSITYYGEPNLTKTVSGLGSVNKGK